jgi:tetratricopeptide (TPR) repeat protein
MTARACLSAVLVTALVVSAQAPARWRPRTAAAQGAGDDGDEAADALARARRHFLRGEQLFALGRFREALGEYEAAFEASPLPELLFNIGQCHRNLGNYEEAIFSFRKYLRLRPEARNRDAVEKLIADLEEQRDRAADAAARRRLIEPPPPPPQDRRSIFGRWWFWTGVAVVAAAAGTAVVLSTDSGPTLPESDLGNVDFGR